MNQLHNLKTKIVELIEKEFPDEIDIDLVIFILSGLIGDLSSMMMEEEKEKVSQKEPEIVEAEYKIAHLEPEIKVIPRDDFHPDYKTNFRKAKAKAKPSKQTFDDLTSFDEELF